MARQWRGESGKGEAGEREEGRGECESGRRKGGNSLKLPTNPLRNPS